MKTCKVEATIRIGGVVTAHKTWPACDIMDTSRTRAWARRKFNKALLDMSQLLVNQDNVVVLDWRADYGGGIRNEGRIAGKDGEIFVMRGIFEGKR